MVVADARKDWIAFASGLGFEAREGPRPTKRAATKKASSAAKTGTSKTWMSQPVQAADPSWVPLAPPGATPERKVNRQRPSSPVIALQPINRGRGLTSSRRSPSSNPAVPSKNIPKPQAARDRTESTQSSSSSSSRENAPRRGRSKAPRGASARSIGMTRPSPSPSPRNKSRNRSQSRTRAAEAGKPARSASQIRRPPVTPTKGRSASLTPRASDAAKRSRSTSRSRPPVTTNAKIARPRSTSRTRVTSPAASPVASRSNMQHFPGPNTASLRKPPPSTARTRGGDVRRGNGSNSIGPGIQASQRSISDDRSTGTADGNIGRKIGFSRQRSSCMASDPGRRSGAPLRMRPRILLAATVYHNTATNLWITTINTNQKGVAKNPALANKYLKAFSFPTENEARESAIANAPPKMVPFGQSPECFMCDSKFAMFRRASHCRNCGVCVCISCSTLSPSKMIPTTYNLKNESNVRVCNGCTSLSNSFKKALLTGNYEEAIALYGTGNINLRTPFPVTSKKDELMHPIHCAVDGGNLDIVRWLIDYHYCPVKLVSCGTKRTGKHSSDVTIQTSKGRSVLTIAIDRLKVDILRYLVVECGVSILETKDLQSTLRALEASLMALPRTVDRLQQGETPISARWDKTFFDDISEPSSLGEDEGLDDSGLVETKSVATKRSRSSRSEGCIICMDRKINCVATPCGHAVCCLECSTNLSACPVCNNRGEFIKIFRP